jgi:hypothetical protein
MCRFVDLFEREGGTKKASAAIKMKKPKQLEGLLELVREILAEVNDKKQTVLFEVRWDDGSGGMQYYWLL